MSWPDESAVVPGPSKITVELAKIKNVLGVLFAGHEPLLIDEANPVDPEVLAQLQAPPVVPAPSLKLSDATRARMRNVR